VRVSTWVWVKSAGFTQNQSRKRQLCPDFLHARGAQQMHGPHSLQPHAFPRRMEKSLGA